MSDARYQRAWFGVSPEASAATALPQYRPDGGVHAIGATSGLTYQLNPRLGLFGFGRYERLVGDAASSPVVRNIGSRDQFTFGLSATYSFGYSRQR